MPTASTSLQRLRRHWDRHARNYDRQMGFMDRKVFGDTRKWLCSRATGDVLEIAIGTGLNLEWYPAEVRLSGVDLSPAMLDHARRRAEATGRQVALITGDAQRLEFADGSFESVVCTFSLCAIPDDRAMVEEMRRVLRPGGRLLLADHVVSTSWPVRVLQLMLELVTIPTGGEHFRRRPIHHVRAAGFVLEQHDRFKLGIVERLVARKSLCDTQVARDE